MPYKTENLLIAAYLITASILVLKYLHMLPHATSHTLPHLLKKNIETRGLETT